MVDSLFSSTERDQRLQQMSSLPLDVLIIGGGITGAGIALDAATRGMKVGLIDMQDFAAGTSSRSTKLVHGGLRYLKQLEVGLVAEVGKERAIVYENGPHVTTPEWMLLPIYKGGTFGKFSTSLGLRVYDFLAGVNREERRSMLTATETLGKEPLLNASDLLGGGYYVEYRTDDARLTIEVLKEAVHRGAQAVNYSKLNQFLYENGKIIGASIVDVISGNTYEVRARKIVNAAGPWVDTLRELDHSKKGKRLQLTKGIHLVIDQRRFPLRQAIYFDTVDGRMMFAIPRDGKAYIGTTDTEYRGDIAHPQVTVADRQYVLEALHHMFPEIDLTEEDVESSWAGVRPLIYEEGKGPSEISRKDEIWQSESGLISMAGGKLTGYRKMAETVVDRVATQLEAESVAGATSALSFLVCSTKNIPISGGAVGGSGSFGYYVAKKTEEGVDRGIPHDVAQGWARKYGSNVDRLYTWSAVFTALAEDFSGGELPFEVGAPLLYAINEEMAVTPVDFFVRRTGALLFNIAWVEKWKEPVIEYMANYLNWTAETRSKYTTELELALQEATVPITAKDGLDGSAS
ncbi:glycerol-3-phosphate dehydrogenase/oxidase [Paenibacillus segetis]|uniref:Glycerol-3-phosphate dehydrogenase n=1 Tax=Paenibacillus segetis TaxID=1325360 RepID=A0ABQ1YMJ0_9BACL|nr:FAD-dependent oxidoreductase [Paenibacillus segetis]GGH30160.1 glycerol-3-phosphate dehydrogenase [Paenibacillus segetis]